MDDILCIHHNADSALQCLHVSFLLKQGCGDPDMNLGAKLTIPVWIMEFDQPRSILIPHTAEVLPQVEGAELAEGQWVEGVGWFGSIPTVVELKHCSGVSSTFVVKQNLQYIPMQILHAILPTYYPRRPAGH